MMNKLLIPVFLLLGLAGRADDFSAVLYDEYGLPASYAVVAVKHSNRAVNADANGLFHIEANLKDTLTLSYSGYFLQYLPLNDSIWKMNGKLQVFFRTRSIQLKEVTVSAQKTAIEVEEERKNLEMKNYDTYQDVSFLQSPLTALYEMFSKKERAKREVAALEYEAKKKNLIKEVLRLYAAYEFIADNPERFDQFADRIQIPDPFFKSATAYEFGVYIMSKYKMYSGENY